MKIAVIGLLGKWSSEQLVEEIRALGHESKVIEMENVVFDLQSRKVTYMGEELDSYDGFIINSRVFFRKCCETFNQFNLLARSIKIPFTAFSS